MRKTTLFLAILVFIFGAGAALAQDGEGGPMNWCSDPEVWGDGRCEQHDNMIGMWFWSCGWYGAHIDAGEISGPGPDWCPAKQVEAITISNPVPPGGTDGSQPPDDPATGADLAVTLESVKTLVPLSSITFRVINLGPEAATNVRIPVDYVLSDCPTATHLVFTPDPITLAPSDWVRVELNFAYDCLLSGTAKAVGDESDPATTNNALALSYSPP